MTNVLIIAYKDISQNRRIPLLAKSFALQGCTVRVLALSGSHKYYTCNDVDYVNLSRPLFAERVLQWLGQIEAGQNKKWSPRFGIKSRSLGFFIGSLEWAFSLLKLPLQVITSKIFLRDIKRDISRELRKNNQVTRVILERFSSKFSDKKKMRFDKDVLSQFSSKSDEIDLLICHDRFAAPAVLELNSLVSVRHILYDAVEGLEFRTLTKIESNSLRAKQEILAAKSLLKVGKSLCVSKALQEELNIDGHVLHNGRPISEQIQKHRIQKNESITLCFGGTFMPHSGLEDAIEMISVLPDVYKLRLIGSFTTDDYRQKINLLIRALNLYDRVEINDNVEVNALPSMIASADAFLIPFDSNRLNLKVSMPNRLFDALAAGIPIFAQSGLYCAQWIEQEGCGFTIDFKSPKSAAKALQLRFSDGDVSRASVTIQDVFLKTSWEAQFSELNTWLRNNTELYTSR